MNFSYFSKQSDQTIAIKMRALSKSLKLIFLSVIHCSSDGKIAVHCAFNYIQ